MEEFGNSYNLSLLQLLVPTAIRGGSGSTGKPLTGYWVACQSSLEYGEPNSCTWAKRAASVSTVRTPRSATTGFHFDAWVVELIWPL